MKIKLTLLFIFFCTVVSAQSFKYPIVVNQGKSIKALVPTHWKVIDSVRGDLNNDKIEDLALIFEFNTAVKESRAYGDNTTEIITEIQKPRILAIYFKSGKNYKLNAQNNNFVLRSEEGGSMGDPLLPLAISDNAINLAFKGGGNWRWKLNYSFKYQNKDWLLTKASNYSYQDSSGEMNHKQYDFISKKRIITIGKVNDPDSENRILEQILPFKMLRTFSSFKKPWTWEIGPDEYL